jgi:hypothetical protein
MSIYVVDSNFFIQAHRATYPLDVAQSFWIKVKQLAIDGKIVSVDKVQKEIYDHQDALHQWCKDNLPQDFFKDTTPNMVEYNKVVNWAVSRSAFYVPNAISEFLHADEADAFVVAFSLSDATSRVVVTQEVSAPFGKNKIKIPDVCSAHGVRFVNTIEMFRQLGETF